MSILTVVITSFVVCIVYDIGKSLCSRRNFCPECGQHLQLEHYTAGSAQACPQGHFVKNYKPYNPAES